jgi:Na+/proline symporter
MFNLTTVILFLIVYFAVFYVISRYTNSYGTTKEGYLVANRNAGLLESSIALIGCWLTGLSIFSGSQQFFINGWAGYFWFTIPQLFGFILFAYLSIRINQKVPNGFTTSEWIKNSYGIGVGTLFQIIFIFACFGNLATTFTAVFKYIKFIEIGNTEIITGLIVAGTALYSFKGGIKTSILTGSIQTAINLVLFTVLAIIAFKSIPADKSYIDFLTGKKNYALFDTTLLLTFGYTAALTFFTGPLMSATHHQKNYAQQNRSPWKSWAYSMPGYFYYQTIICTLGIVALTLGLDIQDPSLTILVLLKSISVFAIAIFGFTLLNLACVIIDAHGNAIASIIANDFNKDKTKAVNVARWSMVAVAIIVWLISLQNFDLTYIFFIYGVLRVNLFIILIGILTTKILTGRGIFWSALVLCPVTVYIGLQGIITKEPILNVYAVSLAMFVTPVIALILSKILPKFR